ncbi:MAG: hypothetical protein AB7J28_06770 [Hyphomonadaceae bacterium]
MALRLIDQESDLDSALDALEGALGEWAGGAHDLWRKEGREGPHAEGASFAVSEHVYIFLENTRRDVLIGAALTDGDRDLVRVEIRRDDPQRHKKRFALARDDVTQKLFLLISEAELRRQDIAEPLRRLAGAPIVKRAHLLERDYVLIGPLDDPRAADALISLAGLAGAHQRHVAHLGEEAARSDAREARALYKIAPSVARRHRVHVKVASALFERLHPFGFQIDDAENGPFKADFAMSRGADTLVFEIRGDASAGDVLRGLGQLALVAPKPAGLARVLILPAPDGDATEALAPFAPAFEELAVSVVFVDFEGAQPSFSIERADDTMAEDVRTLFN